MAERAAKQLELNKSELPNSITEVIATLSRAGFDAYIVGGGVRDTLLGLRPKDFDAVTDAKPHEIKDVFGKRCRIIGRRFQLAHVYSGRELIEVATFRGPPNNKASTTNQDGMILRDNVWGDIKQDFARRDFSINALYYQPLKGVVHDFCGALDDIRNQTIRLLGHAPVRIEEDPVRLLRALRFKAKLGFEFDTELSEQFHDDNWALLEQISPHRLYDETQKMFTGGYLVPLLPLLFESGAIDSLFIYPPSEPSALVKQVAINTDKRIAAGKSINPAFFYAAILWENYLHQLEKAKKRNMPFVEAQMQAASKVIDRQRIKTAIPKFAEQFIRDIWILQPKLSAPRTKQIEQLAEHPRFRAGFDFLLLREQSGDSEHPLSESTNGMGEWWQTYQTLSEKEQQQAINDFDENIRRGAYKRGRSRNRQKPERHTHEQATDKETRDKHATKDISATKDAHVIRDSSNVPSKRRRRADNNAALVESQAQHQPRAKPAASHKPASNKPDSQPSAAQQVKQDRLELAQLQNLSLARHSHSAKNAQSSKPAPLFVIEHERVVPPFERQLAADKAKPSTGRKVPASNKAAISLQTPAKESKPETHAQSKSKSSDLPVQDKPSSTSEKPAQTAIKSAGTVAQTPQLDMSNNEPIPHRRRRRLPSSQPSSKAVTPTSKRQASSAYEKKAPKVVEPSTATTKAAAASQAKPEADNKPAKHKGGNSSKKADGAAALDINKMTATHKGPIPAKRRRRKPSSSNSISTNNA